ATADEDDDTALPSGGKESQSKRKKQRRTGGKRAQVAANAEKVQSRRGVEDGYKKILLLLRNHTGVDFSLYKSTTIQRRITRRVILTQYDSLEGYAGFLRGNVK